MVSCMRRTMLCSHTVLGYRNLYRLGYIHRDISPSNIIVVDGDALRPENVKVVDIIANDSEKCARQFFCYEDPLIYVSRIGLAQTKTTGCSLR